MQTSLVCRVAELDSPAYQRWVAECNHPHRHHRKLWEWAFIAQAVEERGLLRPGVRALGFAVGTEPLTALFAKYGVEVVATDLGVDTTTSGAMAEEWASTDQHAAGVDHPDKDGILPPGVLRGRVQFRPVDMNAIPGDLRGFDFCWSCGSVEHVGTLGLSKAALASMADCVRPGGLAVHTTEFNASYTAGTIERGPTVLYRREDIEEVAGRLRERGHRLVPVDAAPGGEYDDAVVDVEPYSYSPHMKLFNGPYVMTSIGVIIEVGGAAGAPADEPTFVNVPTREERERIAEAEQAATAQVRIARAYELVNELRSLVPEHAGRPAYKHGQPAAFRSACRAGLRAYPAGVDAVLVQALGDTFVYAQTSAARTAAALIRDGCADVGPSVTAVRRARAGHTCVDVGAGTGYTTALLARVVGPSGRVIAVEPDPARVKLLRSTVRANGFTNVEVRADAVCGPDGPGEGDGPAARPLGEIVAGRPVDFVRVQAPEALPAVWDGLAGARAANPALIVVAAFHPTDTPDAEAFLARVAAEGALVGAIDGDGEVVPLPPPEVLLGPSPEDWTLWMARP